MSDESLSRGQNQVAKKASVLESQWLLVLVGIGAGLLVFFILGFNHVIFPSRVGWLLRYSTKSPYFDPSTEFMGWHFFRRAPWTFPLGANRAYGIEFGGSVVYSDSLPLLAILFKPFSPWLGTNFQYVGIWILICFVMQGVFGALLASIVVSRIELKAIIAVFFALSPILLERGWDEYPLMGHWMILWALYLYFRPRSHRIRWVWMVIAILAATTSFYFVPIVLLIWGADAMRNLIWRKENIGWLALEGAGMVATVLLSMWTVGYFVIKVSDAGTQEFGKYAMNLLGPIDSAGRSLVMSAQAHGPHWLGEGYSYAGFGIILLGAMAAYELLRAPLPRQRWAYILPLAVVLLGLAIFSFSNEVALGSHEMIYPNVWGPIGRMFRASARMFWPVYYALWLVIFYLTTRSLKSWQAILLLSTMLAVQVIDYSVEYSHMQRKYRDLSEWQNPLKSTFWDLALQKYHRIVVIPSGEAYPYIPIAYLAANHNMPTNGVYVSRYASGSVIGPISDGRLNALRQNRPNPDTLYIIPNPFRTDELLPDMGKVHGFGLVDGYHVLAPFWFADGHAADAYGLVPGRHN